MKKSELKVLRRMARGSPGDPETKKAKEELERFLEGVPDHLARHLLRMYLLKGWSWKQIAMKQDWQDESTPRKYVKKYMK